MAIDTTYLFITLVSKNSIIRTQLSQSAKTGLLLYIEYQIHPKTQAFPPFFALSPLEKAQNRDTADKIQYPLKQNELAPMGIGAGRFICFWFRFYNAIFRRGT